MDPERRGEARDHRAERPVQGDGELRRALDAAGIGTWRWDRPSSLTWSPSLERIYGLAPGSFDGRLDTFTSLLHPDDRELVLQRIEEAVKGRTGIVVRHRVLRPGGEVRWVEGRGEPILDQQGELIGMRGVGIDVTDRHLAEIALAARARQQAVVAELGQRALGDVEPDVLFDEAARAVAETLQVDIVSILERLPGGRELLLRAGYGWQDGVLGVVTLAAGTESQAGYTLAAGEPVVVADLRTETRFRGPDILMRRGAVSGVSTIIRGPRKPWGVLKAHTTSARVFTSDDVNFLQSVANVLAIATEHRQVADAQRLLAEAGDVLNRSLDYEATLRAFARLLTDRLSDWCAIHVVEDDGTIREIEVAHRDPEKVRLVREFRERYRAPSDSPISVSAVLARDEPLVLSEVTDQMIEDFARDERHLELMREVGFCSLMMLPMRARDRPVGVLQLASAESQRRFGSADVELAAQLAERAAISVDNARLYYEARETAAAREAFLSTASHELRTPLTSIVGFGRRLQRKASRVTSIGPEEREEIDLLMEEAERMNRTLETFLDLARIESGTLELEIETVDLQEVLESEVAIARRRYPHATILEQYPEATVEARTDPHRISQVLTNLIENAVKYGGFRPEVTLRLATLPTGEVQIGVRDRGPGIPPEDRERIFDRFYRSRQSASNRQRGMGLGLYISRGIAQRLHGELDFTSGEGEGTEFTLTIPPAIGEGAIHHGRQGRP